MAPLVHPAACDTKIDNNTAPKHQIRGRSFMNTPKHPGSTRAALLSDHSG
jgi:hypothetical protein